MLADPSPPRSTANAPMDTSSRLCEIGPHTAGSEANTRQREMVKDHFNKMGGKIREQPFRAVHPMTGEQLVMANLVGSWQPGCLRRVVIGAHYDTRPHPDQEVRPGSVRISRSWVPTTAARVSRLLMEIANHLDGPRYTLGRRPGPRSTAKSWSLAMIRASGEYFLGSEEFARIYADRRPRQTYRSMRYEAGIVLDMVGGRNLESSKNPNSLRRRLPSWCARSGAVARTSRLKSFSSQIGPRSHGRPPRARSTSASRRSTSSISIIPTGTKPTTCRRTARARASSKSAAWSPPGSPYRAPHTAQTSPPSSSPRICDGTPVIVR